MPAAKRKLKVLIVDDSIVFRETLAREIAKDPALTVVATAADPYIARDRILEFEPDVMTLDVELPRMNGIEFLRRLLPQYPLPVVVVSAVSGSVFDALDAGAVDFAVKPEPGGRGLEAFVNELIVKIKVASTANIGVRLTEPGISPAAASGGASGRIRVIAIGASTGGTEAVEALLRQFPRDMPGTVVVQHMPPVFTAMYAKRLNAVCAVEVKEASQGDQVAPGRVLIAPGGLHTRIKRGGGGYMVECLRGEKVSGHCPSVDVLFHSAARQAGPGVAAAILTGMGGDGAGGLLAVRQAGGRTFGQDAATCVVYGMPKVAYEIGAVEEQAPLGLLAQKLVALARGKGRA